MKITVTTSDLANVESAFLALPFSSGELKKEGTTRLAEFGIELQVLHDFKAEAGEVVVLYSQNANGSALRLLFTKN